VRGVATVFDPSGTPPKNGNRRDPCDVTNLFKSFEQRVASRSTNTLPEWHCEAAEERPGEAGDCANYANCRNGKRLEGYASQRFLGERASPNGPEPIEG
jgi:hypothetical protein